MGRTWTLRDRIGQAVAIALERGALLVGELQHAFERFESAQGVPQLPAPVIPVAIVGFGEEGAAEGPRASADRESRVPGFRARGRLYGLQHGNRRESIEQPRLFTSPG
jgi:hypothetical protein